MLVVTVNCSELVLSTVKWGGGCLPSLDYMMRILPAVVPSTYAQWLISKRRNSLLPTKILCMIYASKEAISQSRCLSYCEIKPRMPGLHVQGGLGDSRGRLISILCYPTESNWGGGAEFYATPILSNRQQCSPCRSCLCRLSHTALISS